MPNKYEREIEEILRNLERSDPKAGVGRKGAVRERPYVGARHTLPVIRLTFSEWCLVIACTTALVGGGWAYAQHADGGNLITGVLAVIGMICLVCVAVSPFITRTRRPATKKYNNVTRMPGNPFRRLGTRWHLLMLKMRYSKRRDHE